MSPSAAGEVFLEIVVNVSDAEAGGIESRDEIEDPLEQALTTAGLGEVTGGGGGSGVYVVDVEIPTEKQFDEALRLIRRVLKDLKVPTSTRIKRHEPEDASYTVRSDSGREASRRTRSRPWRSSRSRSSRG